MALNFCAISVKLRKKMSSYSPKNQPNSSGVNRLEGVCVCVDYSDFLAASLKHNLHHFDRFVVVTTEKDKATQELCEKYSTECVITEDFHIEHNSSFNKGKMINLGLAHLRQNGWILHLDADIILPDRYRNLLDKHVLEPDCIYGAMRFNCVGVNNFKKYLSHPEPQFHHRYMVDTPGYLAAGATMMHKEYGYVPIGYHQLWHSSKNRKYPAFQGSAEHSDVLFAIQWGRNKRNVLPGIRVIHLESEKAKMGINWGGRKTAKFDYV
jgi:hypothetical protein